MSPLDCLLSQLFDEDPLGLVLALLEQLGDELPVGLGDRRGARVQQRDLRGRRRLQVQNLGFAVAFVGKGEEYGVTQLIEAI